MERYKYTQPPFGIVPQDIVDEYNLTEISHNGKGYIYIQEGMYGLTQAGRIAHDRFKKRLEKHIYQPVMFNPGLCYPSPSTSFLMTLE